MMDGWVYLGNALVFLIRDTQAAVFLYLSFHPKSTHRFDVL